MTQCNELKISHISLHISFIHINPNSGDNKGSCWILKDFYCLTMLRVASSNLASVYFFKDMYQIINYLLNYMQWDSMVDIAQASQRQYHSKMLQFHIPKTNTKSIRVILTYKRATISLFYAHYCTHYTPN